MIIHSKKLEEGSVIHSDICIIGAGAAGITLAKELSSSKLKITLVESGGLEPESETQKLAIGKNEGSVLPAGSHYLYSSRLRYFGGSTNHWAGYLRPLDMIDFEKRDWIEHSGWPFSYEEIKKGYQKALSYVGVDDFEYAEALQEDLSEKNILSQSKLFTTRYFHIAKKLRFKNHYLSHFKKNKNVRLVLYATAVCIRPRRGTQKIKRIEAMTLGRKKIFFESKYFVLAAGGIENPRLLLLSDQYQKKGLGNQNDLVGRFFMEHPHLPVGRLFMKREISLLKYYRRHNHNKIKHPISATLCPSEKSMRENRLMNLNIQLVRRFKRIKDGKIIDHSDSLGKAAYPLLTDEDTHIAYAHMKVRAEQSPNPESRVILSNQKDPLGLRMAHLKWYLKPEDLKSIQKNLELLGRELGAYSLGRTQISIHSQENWPEFTYGGSHHMGTTRMHNSPKQGVVDANLKLHGYSNLFILGCSVFPTGGGVNPTLTILALASKLAEHFKNDFS